MLQAGAITLAGGSWVRAAPRLVESVPLDIDAELQAVVGAAERFKGTERLVDALRGAQGATPGNGTSR